MRIRITTPYSHLFEDLKTKNRILEASDAIELRSPMQAGMVDKPVLFHSDLSVVVPWSCDELDELRELATVTLGQLRAISFHLLSQYRENYIEAGAFVGQGKPMDRVEMEEAAKKNIQAVRAIFGADMTVLLENNNHLGTDAYNTVTDPGFIRSLVERLGLRLLLDIAHARITAHNMGIDEKGYLEALPLNRVVQVHLSKFKEKDGKAIDAHDALINEDFNYFVELLPRLPRLEYVTIEYYKNSNILVRLLKHLSDILNGL